MATHVSDTGSKGKTRGSASDELALIAQRAQAFTNASGTAIALSEGSVDEIVCRARSGSSAPEVGTALRVEGSFTGLCIQSGRELRCDDAETDTRVDTAAIRALGIRSMVITPIKDDSRVVGVLAVFAPTAHAFTITHVAVLKTMADQISALLQKERRAKEGEPPANEPSTASPPGMPGPANPPSPIVMTPAASTPASLGAPAPRPAFPVISKKVEPIKTTVVAEEIVTPVMLSKREEKPREEARSVFTSFDGAVEEKKSGVSLILVGVAAVIVIGAASVFAYLKLYKPSTVASVPPRVQDAPSAPATQPSTEITPATTAATTPTTTATIGNSQPAATSSAPPLKPAVDNNASEAARKADKTTPRSNPGNVSAGNVAEKSAPAKPSPETVALATAPSKISTQAADSGQTQESAPALNLGGAGPAGSGALSALAKPAGAVKPSVVTQSELEPVQVLKRVPPVYPAIARQRRLSGILVVQATVGKDGKISGMELVSGPPVFRDAAFEAIRQWQFKPATLNGQPIDQSTQIRLQFNP